MPDRTSIQNCVVHKKSEPNFATLCKLVKKKVSEYDQEIPQSHTADQPTHRKEMPQNI